ncbi:MAG: NUDIX hydrolase [Rhizobiales bacterium]|nr:NUDIX hydrolase [Hyphomicrobiales bacterium]
MKPVPQVGALPWRRRNGAIEFLLVTSRTTARWVIPKGGTMAHLVDMNAARQEAFEEAGVVGRMRRKRIGFYTYRKIDPDGAAQLCRVKVFALEVRGERKTWPEMRQRKRRWFAVDGAFKRIGERDLRMIIRSFAKDITPAKAL